MKNDLKKKVILGLSGGVDSTTAALLLLKKGFNVTGLYFDIEKNGNINTSKVLKAKAIAKKLKIDFIYKNLSTDFENKVIKDFCQNYLSGKTPNPCVICNPQIKFKCLEDYADQIGAPYVSTGHYARIGTTEKFEGEYIRRAANEKKDQSYMLYRLSQSTIKRTLFPLGELESKEKVREIARNEEFENSEEKDSQEICFLGKNKTYVDFIKSMGIKEKSGKFCDKKGIVLGNHKGILNYTVGQRKGLGITFGKPMYVTALDSNKNIVYLGKNEELFKNEIHLSHFFFTISDTNLPPYDLSNLSLAGKIRYSALSSPCKIIHADDSTIKILFENSQRAATPGQSVVLYYGDLVIGGGFIKNSFKNEEESYEKNGTQ